MRPTDDQLRKRAEALAIMATSDEGAGSTTYRMGARMGMASELYGALLVDRRSRELLLLARSTHVTAFAYWEEHGYKEEAALQKERVKDIDVHISALEQRLGVERSELSDTPCLKIDSPEEWGSLACAIRDELGENTIDSNDEPDPYNWWLVDMTTMDLVDFLKKYAMATDGPNVEQQ